VKGQWANPDLPGRLLKGCAYVCVYKVIGSQINYEVWLGIMLFTHVLL